MGKVVVAVTITIDKDIVVVVVAIVTAADVFGIPRRWGTPRTGKTGAGSPSLRPGRASGCIASYQDANLRARHNRRHVEGAIATTIAVNVAVVVAAGGAQTPRSRARTPNSAARRTEAGRDVEAGDTARGANADGHRGEIAIMCISVGMVVDVVVEMEVVAVATAVVEVGDATIVGVVLAIRQLLDTAAKGRTHGACRQPNRIAVLGQGPKTLLFALRACAARGVDDANSTKQTIKVIMSRFAIAAARRVLAAIVARGDGAA